MNSKRSQEDFKLPDDFVDYSISMNTTEESDIVGAIEYALEGIVPPGLGLWEYVTDFWNADSEGNKEESTLIFNEGIIDTMNSIAPGGTSFGGHPGDPSNYGFWRHEV